MLGITGDHHSMTAGPALGGAAAATCTVTRHEDRVPIEAHGAAGPRSARAVGPGARMVSAAPGATRLEFSL
jgi:hypothetical protein